MYGVVVYRLPVVLSIVAVVAGLILYFTMSSLLSALLIVGGVGGLGWSVFPAGIATFARWLSVGRSGSR
jgi:hypothetical protein